MKKYLIGLLCFTLLLSGCLQPLEGEVLAGTIEAEHPVRNIETEEPDVEEPHASNLSEPSIFDFAVLSEADFPRGIWTVNQLISKYGEPKSVKGDVYFIITAAFDDVQVTLLPPNRSELTDFEIFSFYPAVREVLFAEDFNDEENLEEYQFDLDEADKNLYLRVSNLIISDKSIKFPYGITIGEKTKSQILNSYPHGSWSYCCNDAISYLYDFSDEKGNLPVSRGNEGNITYFFDEYKVLQEVSVWWHYFSR